MQFVLNSSWDSGVRLRAFGVFFSHADVWKYLNWMVYITPPWAEMKVIDGAQGQKFLLAVPVVLVWG